MNLGPNHDGRLMPIFQERLLQMGKIYEVFGFIMHKFVDIILLTVFYRVLAKSQWGGHLQNQAMEVSE